MALFDWEQIGYVLKGYYSDITKEITIHKLQTKQDTYN